MQGPKSVPLHLSAWRGASSRFYTGFRMGMLYMVIDPGKKGVDYCFVLTTIGVNTNFGGSADLRTSNFAELQRALIRELHYGVLPPGERDHHVMSRQQSSHHYDSVVDGSHDVSFMPRSWARAAIVIRINSLVSGCSAVRPVVVERMQDLLQYDIIPMIPLRGSISASGDLSPLSYICGAIQGKSTIRVLSGTSNAVYADTALAETGLEPVMIEAKEGLASKLYDGAAPLSSFSYCVIS